MKILLEPIINVKRTVDPGMRLIFLIGTGSTEIVLLLEHTIRL